MKIILIGFMGVGKTSVGKQLARKLNFNFIDTDYEIERLTNKSIPDIFEQYGENYFRKLENSILEKFVKNEDIVMATGGGIITTKENYNILKNEEKVIFLDGSVETIINHVQNERNQRPLLKESENLSKKIEELLSIRYEKYIEVSDILIDINGKNIDEVISQILVYIG
ncbi:MULTISPECIES: shikimate kinase [Romboutsia]|jgi:shikimate kinase|uniref:Shikimate kinase n=1 Tax=Romboutsia ilealis TaxID=1115758 RepID=A0A1V1I4M6_9FIRM|nr:MULTISPECIES: shikimate kinase [Romboutsia]MCI9061557.1 shikimate kinase [Romboutsia sp.]MCI9258844.1 shikimate kinase [Romboutsia sp.]CED94484.1 Shikimate kinase [Romboutsia ilealis]